MNVNIGTAQAVVSRFFVYAAVLLFFLQIERAKIPEQSNDAIPQKDNLTLGKFLITFNQIEKAKKTMENDGSGSLVTYSFPDASFIFIYESTVVTPPILKFKNGEIYFQANSGYLDSFKGVRANKTYFREDIYQNHIHFIYDRVPVGGKNYFESILNSVKVKRI